MLSKKSVSAIAITAFMLLSSAMMFMSQKADAASWLTTTDTDFAPGNFFTGTGFESVLHGTGAAAYIQNKIGMMNWIQKMPGTNTGPRTQFGFANDSAESRFILFGGLDGISSWRNDTWEYNYAGENWEQICADNTPACAPPKRIGPSMAYDNNSKVVVMYGGMDDQGRGISDTWEYNVNTNTWTNTTPVTLPRGMFAHRMVYDAKDKKVILVGRGTSSMEVWEYDAVANTWTNRNAIGGPSQRAGYALGYSYQASHQRVVLFGGAEVMTLFDETWEYNYASNSWSQVSPVDKPSARTGAQMTYNFKQSIEGLILWGGNSWSTETWHYNWTGSTPTWNQIMTTTTPNPGRTNHGLAYDPGYNALMIYGGEPFSGPKRNDTWMLEAGYNLEGRYYTTFLNTYTTATIWQKIFFNKTSEPLTQIRFQVEANNVCDNAAIPNFLGPNGLPNQYYTIFGQDLWAGLTGNKCLRWMADMITNDPSVAPQLQDVTIIYNATPTKPQVESYAPQLTGHPINSHIYINFTKPVDPANTWVFVWQVVPQVNFTLDPFIWKEANSKIEITHNSQLFLEAKAYRVRVYAADTLNQPLDYPAGYFQWTFTTVSVPPRIMSTVPAPNAIDVALNAPVIITFSEPMNTASCWPFVTIDPLLPPTLAFDGHSWSAGDTVLTMTHSVPYAQFTTFTVDVPIGNDTRPCQDKSDILLTYGPTAVPWPFTTLAINPFITLTNPMSMKTEVATNQNIEITFSRDMNPAAFYYNFKEWDVPTLAWKNWTPTFNTPFWTGVRKVTLTHTTAFGNCKPYRVQVWALDTAGNSLIKNPNVPNPWKFMTIGPGGVCGPFMIFTTPYDGEEDVPLWKNITIAFYYTPPDTGGMDPSTFTYTLKDQWGNDLASHFTLNWLGMGPNAVELLHPGYPFDACGEYTVRVLTARDTSGRALIPGPAENPFKFKTIATGCRPSMIWTQPANGTLNAPVNQFLVLQFSEQIDRPSLIVTIRPNVTLGSPAWTDVDTNVSFAHASSPFVPCTWYNVSVFANNMAGLNLGRGPVPNPFMFRAFCINGPYIVSTYPANAQTGIPLTASIWVNFSEPMDTSSLSFTLSPLITFNTPVWSNGDMTVRLDHATPYTQNTLYTARVVAARNKTGGNLVGGGAPNPWTFRSYTPPPYIVTTIPPDGATGVLLDATITVIFSVPMDQTSVTFATTPPLTYSQQWPNGQTVVFSHTTPFNICTLYSARVLTARDLGGTSLGSGSVPNPWTFTSDCRFPVRGLKVTRQAPNVRLDWTADPQVQFWNVYTANDRLTPWPWTMIANITTPSNNFYIHTNAISDMANHFYIVRGFKPGGWSSNSTMGALWHPTLAPNVGRPSAFWFSLPYNSMYKKAKDISDELTYLKINVVAKFDPAKQQTVIWHYSHGAWRGTNFNIAAGEGLMIGIVNNFDWAINGTDKIISMTFTFRPQLRTNLYWISLPYTNGLASASQLVTAIAGGTGPGTNTKIIAVGKWVYSTQSSRVFGYTVSGWSGDNFNIVPGDGIWIEIVSSFAWSPTLITAEVP
jgi:hypothetical protein